MRPSPLALLAAGLTATAIGGCGSTTTVAAGGTLQVAITEYRITPQAVHAAPGTLTIVAHNDGRLSHNLVIFSGGMVEALTPPIAPGQWAQVVAVLPAGHYQMASALASDQALGTYGTLNVGRG